MPASIGTRRELFVDDWLIEEMREARLELHRPERREVALATDAPWEDFTAYPLSIVRWNDGWRLYYRAGIQDLGREGETAVWALAESSDGLTFARPELDLCQFRGSKENNILADGGALNLVPPFVDTNPAGLPDQRFKGLGVRDFRAYAMSSADGICWSPMQDTPLDMTGHFDSINTSFWDDLTKCYHCYTRSWHDRDTRRVLSGWDFAGLNPVRAIQHAISPDFIHWSQPEQLEYADGDYGTQLYTNAIVPCPGAGHIYLGFPNRFVEGRKRDPSHSDAGVNDALFMSSRDGIRWTRWLDAWVPPGLDPLNWTDRNNYPVWGIAETSPVEWSMYITEHYEHKGVPTQMRRLAIRPWGFVSVRAGHTGGEMLTKPFTFAGARLRLNARTSAAGSIQVEIRDEHGHPVPGFASDDMAPWFGDAIDEPIEWKGGGDLSHLYGKPVRLRFILRDADVFAMQFVG